MSDAERVRAGVSFRGHVQGVGFRYQTRACAQAAGVTGWVRNADDGSVELVAEGTEEVLLDFLAALRRSHVQRFIRSEQLSWTAATGQFSTFEIRP